jgi:hypothetical protein
MLNRRTEEGARNLIPINTSDLNMKVIKFGRAYTPAPEIARAAPIKVVDLLNILVDVMLEVKFSSKEFGC